MNDDDMNSSDFFDKSSPMDNLNISKQGIEKMLLGRNSIVGDAGNEARIKMNLAMTISQMFDDNELKSIRILAEKKDAEGLKSYMRSELKDKCAKSGLEWDYLWEKICELYDIEHSKRRAIYKQFNSKEEMNAFKQNKDEIRKLDDKFSIKKFRRVMNKSKLRVEIIRK